MPLVADVARQVFPPGNCVQPVQEYVGWCPAHTAVKVMLEPATGAVLLADSEQVTFGAATVRQLTVVAASTLLLDPSLACTE